MGNSVDLFEDAVASVINVGKKIDNENNAQNNNEQSFSKKNIKNNEILSDLNQILSKHGYNVGNAEVNMAISQFLSNLSRL